MSRYGRAMRIHRMDPERDYEKIFMWLVRYEFPWDYYRAVELAFLNDYGVPSISRLLDKTAEFRSAGQKRYDDTLLIGYEATIANGMDTPRGRQAIRQLNRIHGQYDISNEDYLYVLSTIVVGPVRWIQRYGWRPLTDAELQAIVRLHVRFGELMGITGIPESYSGFEELHDKTVATRFAYDPANQRVAEDTMGIFAAWFPKPLRKSVLTGASTLISKELRTACGIPDPPAWLIRAVDRALLARRAVLRHVPERPDARPFNPRPRTYPFGWSLERLGPDSFHEKAASA